VWNEQLSRRRSEYLTQSDETTKMVCNGNDNMTYYLVGCIGTYLPGCNENMVMVNTTTDV
jgi:hypothetical protein